MNNSEFGTNMTLFNNFIPVYYISIIIIISSLLPTAGKGLSGCALLLGPALIWVRFISHGLSDVVNSSRRWWTLLPQPSLGHHNYHHFYKFYLLFSLLSREAQPLLL